jgi:purine-cytosine permease-like protein
MEDNNISVDGSDISKEDAGFASNEYERQPVPENKTKGLKSFVGLFAGEHVAATELLIGPLFVASGVSAFDVLVGLLVGNLLAVLSWTFITAPIATKKRMTLYYQLEKIGGPAIIDVYNLANGILWCCLGGAFIYVSATALFGPLNLPSPQLTDWGPNSFGMVAVILAVGAVIVYVAAKGYDTVARFANIASPWMVMMFIVFGIVTLPELGVKSAGDFWRVANEVVWDGVAAEGATKFTFWHVVCFAWFGNMAWHLGMGDLSIFRYAKKASYGLASAAGMYLGHYIAWITAGFLYAVQLQADPTNTSVVPGPMAYRVAGVSGIVLVILAGWTTANPVIYRAGLAFQAIRPKWSRVKVTMIAGIVACIVAVFPGLCNRFLSVAMLYGLVLMPMGAVIFVDHYLMKRFGMQEFYAEKTGKLVHWPPLIAWLSSLLFCVGLWYFKGIEIFFLCLPGWLFAGVVYFIASKAMQKSHNVKEVL